MVRCPFRLLWGYFYNNLSEEPECAGGLVRGGEAGTRSVRGVPLVITHNSVYKLLPIKWF